VPLPFPHPQLATSTLTLREWRESDAPVLLAAGHDSLISRYRYSLPRTPDAARQWVVLAETDRDQGTRLELAIEERGTPVGSVSLTDFEHGNAMVRYWLLPEGRGRGLTTAAVGLLTTWAFSRLGIGRLAAFVEVDNSASWGVLERAGPVGC
jgi:RimJ/RimL family protein N-acetyltransferase